MRCYFCDLRNLTLSTPELTLEGDRKARPGEAGFGPEFALVTVGKTISAAYRRVVHVAHDRAASHFLYLETKM